jgi:nicotinamide phosphoribosyltransferase
MGPGFNLEGWNYIVQRYGGRLPVEIKAIPEGTPIPTGNVLMTVENTDEKCWWLTNHLETLLSNIWAPCTLATLSREIKILCKHYLELTSDTIAPLDFMLHDFGARGTTSPESAGICGAGHLVNFKGTDTLRAIETAMDYYHSGVCAYSVNATEHSIMTALGKEGEKQVVRNLLAKYPDGILSIVIDSYDYENFITTIALELKEGILAREGKTVFRPDSGEPVSTTLRVLELLNNVFGSYRNHKGYLVLHDKVGVLWGDGIKYDGIRNILHAMKNNGWSAQNIVFGMGGGLHQDMTRDTQRFAFKSSAQCRNNRWYDIFKQPTDTSKMSKGGKQYLYFISNQWVTESKIFPQFQNKLQTAFKNGQLIIDQNMYDIRERAAI